MRHSGELDMVEEYNRKYGDNLIGKEGEYKCNKCHKVWIPTDADINKKAMMTYYKCCTSCRAYLYKRELARKARIGGGLDALRIIRPLGRIVESGA